MNCGGERAMFFASTSNRLRAPGEATDDIVCVCVSEQSIMRKYRFLWGPLILQVCLENDLKVLTTSLLLTVKSE